MEHGIYKLLVLAIACEIPGDAAYKLLNDDFIEQFQNYYKRVQETTKAEECPSTLDALINFTIVRLPDLLDTPIDTSILYNLRSRRSEIVSAFLNQTLSDMITKLASRDTILDAIIVYLRGENLYRAVFPKINRSRVSVVFTQFLDFFHASSAGAFEFGGDFKNFVMFSFINFFYPAHKQDIWDFISEVDDVKFELEHSIVTERQISVSRSDDLKIHDLLMNIKVVNDLLFKHSGQTADVYGVMYDIYYLMLCELCAAKVAEINAALKSSMGDASAKTEDFLVFVDPLDRREARFAFMRNKGISAKIQNAKELIPYIFNYIRDGNLNVSSLADLRSHCFELGKHEREGRNCVWEDVQKGAETSHYLDTETARANYDAFDKILRGVISVYTLMTELENRGRSLVDGYNGKLFKDENLIRYLDYLSSLDYIDLIEELQAEPVPEGEACEELFEFNRMVDEYIGSSVNNHSHIRENRYYHFVHGLLKQPKLKQETAPKTDHDKLSLVTRALNAVPHGYFEFISGLNQHFVAQYARTSWIRIPASDVVPGKYHSLYFNSFFRANPELAAYYLNGSDRFKSIGLGLTPDVSWNVRNCYFSGVSVFGSVGVWLPLNRKFYMFGLKSGGELDRLTVVGMSEIQVAVRENRNVNADLQLVYDWVRPLGNIAQHVSKIGDAVSFPLNVGIANLTSSDIMGKLPNTKLLDKYHQYVMKYYRWMNEVSTIQHSVIDVLRTMYVQALYWVHPELQQTMESVYGENILAAFQSGEFEQTTLDWVLDVISKDERAYDIEWNVKQGQLNHKLDKTVLVYCFGDASIVGDDPAAFDFCVDIMRRFETPAERFVAIYNHICAKLEFLTLLRDSLSLLFSTVPSEAASLNCEFNSRFEIVNAVSKYVQSPITFGVRVLGQKPAKVKADITETREFCMKEFKTLLEFFTGYVRDSESSIAGLVNYNISSQSDIASRFASWGETFNMMKAYNGILELDRLRKVAITDSAGFFVMNGSYFKGQLINVTYYVHRSGRMLADLNGKLQAWVFDFTKEKDMRLYRQILSVGFKNGGK